MSPINSFPFNLISVDTNLNLTPLGYGVNGPGYFVVRDPVSGEVGATRLGSLTIDANGYLVNSLGWRVQGYDEPSLTVIGDLQIGTSVWQGTNGSRSAISSYEILTNGDIVVTLTDNSSVVEGQILLQSFQNPSALAPEGWRSYGWSALAGPLPQAVPPGASGTGWLTNGVEWQLVPQLQLSPYAGRPSSFSQGVLVPSGLPTDIGIEGNGFFVLRRTNDGALFATRAGGFYLDGSGYVVHYSGLRLQGYEDAARTTVGDVRIDMEGGPSSGGPAAGIYAFVIDAHGVITLTLSDGKAFVRGQVLLQNCANPDLVGRTNFDLYPINTNTDLWSPLAPPLSGQLGWLVSGTVELGQFDTNLLAVRSTLNFFIQGALTNTGIAANLGLNGPGFFTVRDPVANVFYATRSGNFSLDASNHLITVSGMRVQGLTNAGLTQSGDITIDAAGTADPTLQATSYAVENDGSIWVSLPDGSIFLRGQILVQDYRNLQGLVPVGNNLYSNVTAAVPMFTNGLSGYVQRGSVISGALELASAPPALQLPPPGGFRIFISNLLGGTMEASSDTIHWEAIGQVNGSPDLNVAEFFDAPQISRRFYRVVTSD